MSKYFIMKRLSCRSTVGNRGRSECDGVDTFTSLTASHTRIEREH